MNQSTNHYTVSQLLKRLRNRGLNINKHDIVWSRKVGLISPIRVRDNLFYYTHRDEEALFLLSCLKRKMVDKTILSRILKRDTLKQILEMSEIISSNLAVRGERQNEYFV